MANQGVGRTHLFLGQVDNATVPSAGAADLYVLTDGYGQATGTDTPMTIETPDIAPLGLLGRWRARLLSLPIQYGSACTVEVTPVVDFMTELDPTIVALAAPAARTRTAIQVKMLRACTTLRIRVVVLARTGALEVYMPVLYYTPLKVESGMAFGEAP